MPAHALTATALAATALAATLLSPPAATTAETNASDIEMVPLVREDVGVWYTVSVRQACPDSHPYVHADGWIGSLPEHVYFDHQYDGASGEPATAIRGGLTNWNFEPKSVPLDLKCTSDAGQAIQIPTRWD